MHVYISTCVPVYLRHVTHIHPCILMYLPAHVGASRGFSLHCRGLYDAFEFFLTCGVGLGTCAHRPTRIQLSTKTKAQQHFPCHLKLCLSDAHGAVGLHEGVHGLSKRGLAYGAELPLQGLMNFVHKAE